MKITSLLLASLMFFQLVLFPSPAIAAISASGGGASGQAQVNKIGKLLLAEGIATLTATTIEISSNNQSGQQQSQLQGKLFKTEQSGSVIKGLAFFNKGRMLSELPSNCQDYIVTNGTKVPGSVEDVTGTNIRVGGKDFPISEVEVVHCSSVFKYNTKVGESPKLKLNPTCIKAKAAGHSKTKMSTKRKIIIGTVAVCLIVGIACGIAIPLAVAGGGRGGGGAPAFIAPAPSRSVPTPKGP